jgi:hypothetical protein
MIQVMIHRKNTLFTAETTEKTMDGKICFEKKSGRVDERKNGRTLLLSSTPPFLHSMFIRETDARRPSWNLL